MKKVVIESEIKEVFVGNVNANKIYAFKPSNYVYKLHFLGQRDGSYGWAFVSLANSLDYAYGITVGHNKGDAMILAIKSIIDNGFEVYEFSLQGEFLEWCLK